MTSSGVRCIELLEVWIQRPADLSPGQCQRLILAGETCPAKESLQGAVPMRLHWS